MITRKTSRLAWLLFALAGTASASTQGAGAASDATSIGRVNVSTIPFSDDLQLRTATYTPSGKVLVVYYKEEPTDRREVNIGIMDDDGKNLRPIFSGLIPPREKDNGIRYMMFADNKRIFMGDFVLECAPNLDACDQSTLLPVEYPEQIASGPNILHRWSEIIIAPDNKHIAWTTLLSNYSAMVFTGELEKQGSTYKIVDPQIINTLDPFREDPKNPDGVVPSPVRNGEVKQFVDGGRAISMVGALERDTADSVVLDIATGDMVQITDTPGYNETTIFAPDEKLGIVMTTRFSPKTDMAVLGLMPRPHPVSLNMGLSWHTYIYSVAGVRETRPGNIGPALIDIEASKSQENYQGVNLNTEADWVYRSPMSWHPSGKKAMWLEGRRGSGRDGEKRIQVVELLDYQPAAPVGAQPTPDEIPYASSDLSAVDKLVQRGSDIDVKVYGRHAGHIEYRRTPEGLTEKKYVDFSDDGKHIYKGSETMRFNPQGNSTYTADVELLGPEPGKMDLTITFGPLKDKLPARLIFDRDASGNPLTHGYAEYDGVRLNVESLVP